MQLISELELRVGRSQVADGIFGLGTGLKLKLILEMSQCSAVRKTSSTMKLIPILVDKQTTTYKLFDKQLAVE